MHRLHTEAPLAGGTDEGGDLYIGKSVTCALCLTLRNLAVPNNQSRNKATKDAHGYVIPILIADSHHWLYAFLISYIHTCVGFGVARSD